MLLFIKLFDNYIECFNLQHDGFVCLLVVSIKSAVATSSIQHRSVVGT